MGRIIVLVGLPASGKSSFAKAEVKANGKTMVRVSRDDLRSMLFNDICLDKREAFISEVEKSIVMSALASGKNVIVDACHIS
jgi:predicted kinase